jgi:hypothetical protein
MSFYLREDIANALERAATASDLPVSRVVEILLGFSLELNDIIERERFLIEMNRRFHRTP